MVVLSIRSTKHPHDNACNSLFLAISLRELCSNCHPMSRRERLLLLLVLCANLKKPSLCVLQQLKRQRAFQISSFFSES